MENELIVQQFEALENKIEGLIQQLVDLQSTNDELNENIRQLEKQLQDRIDAEAVHDEEKAMVKAKIEGLINRIERLGAKDAEATDAKQDSF